MSAKPLARKGKPRLVPEQLIKEIADNLDALLALDVSPAGTGELIVNGKKAILKLDIEAIAAAAIIPLAPYKSAALAVSLRYGVINDTASGPHELSSYGPFTIAATSYFFAKVTCNGDGEITTVEPHAQSTITPPAFSDTVSYKYLGRAVVTAGTMATPQAQILGSQNYRRVGYTGNYAHLFEPA